MKENKGQRYKTSDEVKRKKTMGLGLRINRVIKSNLNDIAGNFNRTEGAMFLAGGGVAGAGISATVGNMGLEHRFSNRGRK
ncbi:MAG: hypothetical protein ACREPR_23860 [Brasilonema sp.]